MKGSLEEDLKKLKRLAFKRRERCGRLVERFHALEDQIQLFAECERIWNVYDWLLTPLTLWPLDFEGLAQHTLKIVEGEEQMDKRFRLLLRMLRKPPAKETQDAIADYEHNIENGNYHGLLRQPAKFEEMEVALNENAQLKELWEEIKQVFDAAKFRNKRGVIRRRLSQERNFREGWKIDWGDERSQFYAAFDAFCYAWGLYGMEGDRPLVMKISVNPTPYGTLIFIPNHWSFDAKRDLDWGGITKLHRVQLRAARQGPKLSAARVQRRAEAELAKKLWAEAGEKGLRGQERYEYVCARMAKDPRTDPSWLKRLLSRARE